MFKDVIVRYNNLDERINVVLNYKLVHVQNTSPDKNGKFFSPWGTTAISKPW